MSDERSHADPQRRPGRDGADPGPDGLRRRRRAPHGALRRAKSPACRTVEAYDLSAWVAPTAIVLQSAGAWKSWNEKMAEQGLAVAAEAVPENVDWSNESVVVVALGELSDAYHLQLAGAHRDIKGTHVSLTLESGRGGTSPAVVLALSKKDAARMTLNCDAVILPEVEMYSEPAALAGGTIGEPSAVQLSWGAMKAEYR